MTKQQLENHRKWLRLKYGTESEDIFHQAWIYAQGYGGIEKINQSLFGLLCRWAARELLTHRKHEIPFSCLRQENQDKTDEMEYDPEDPEWEKQYRMIEEREELQKIYGQWLLDALLNATTEPKPNKVTTDRIDIQMELFA